MRKLILILALAGAFTAFGLVAHQDHAAAFYGCGIGYAYDPTHAGYFTGNKGSAPCNVLPYPALLNVNSTSTFFSYMQDYLYQQNSKGENLSVSNKWIAMVGAAFIIDKMLGYPGKAGVGSGITYAKNNFSAWKASVMAINNDPSAAVGINWNFTPTYAAFCNGTTNSAYSPDIGDDVMYPTACPWDYNHSLPEIKIFWAGGSFEIGKQCGNVELSFKPLPVDSPPTGSLTLACDAAAGQWIATATIGDPDGSTTGHITVSGPSLKNLVNGANPPFSIPTSDAPANSSVTVKVYATDVGPVGSGLAVLVASANTTPPCQQVSCGTLTTSSTAIDPYMSFSLTASVQASGGPVPSGTPINLSVVPTQPPQQTYTYNNTLPSNGSGSATFALPSLSSQGTTATGLYKATWSAASASCSDTFAIVNLPYVNIYGGDAMAGASPVYDGTSSQCAVDPNGQYGGLYGWNTLGAAYDGAGAQYAVQALGAIDDFAGALSSSNTKPDGLSFANTFAAGGATKDNPSGGLFGGYFGDPTGGWTGSCDFTSDSGSPTSADVTVARLGNYTVPLRTQEVHYITGHDVYIAHSVLYSSSGSSWAKISDIPSFRVVVVGGNIYIGSGVATLDGLYVAEPDASGSGGLIYTCASGLRTPVLPTTANYFTTCHNKLTINGAFVARQVQFGRTIGTVGQAGSDTLNSNHDAEVFNYTPELWLPRNSSTTDNGYAAITGLPPVL